MAIKIILYRHTNYMINNKIKIIKWDITEQDVDVVINSANPRLSAWWGISGYIHRKAWTKLVLLNLEELKKLWKKFLEIWEPVITDWLNLKQKIIHIVWPKYHINKDNWKELLWICYLNSLKLAEKEWLNTIAFPSISTGIYWCPIKEASYVVLDVINNYLKNSEIEEVRIVLFNEEDFHIYNNEYNERLK